MQHVEETLADITAKGGCYNCTNPADGIVFDAQVEGEGILFICSGCLFEAAKIARAGRARLVRKVKSTS